MSGKKEKVKIETEDITPEGAEEARGAEEADETKGTGEAEEIKEEGTEANENEKYLRLMADFQNYKRRSEKEKADIYSYANEKIFIELLAVMDDFERALLHEADVSGSFTEGMFMIFKNFKGILEKAGLSEIEALGEVFDPNIHNAVMAEAESGYESGRVSEVIQKGYRLNNRVIRPSMVKVAE
jgi:molecular chaperone GrpE